VVVRRFFEDRHRRFGATREALDWSAHGQLRRFEVLGEVADFSGRSVLDVGSGLGDFLAFLAPRSHDVRYTGYDIVEAFVDHARSRFPDAAFQVRDVLREGIAGEFDLVVSSGLHNVENGGNEEEMASFLRKAWDAAKVAVAVNMLSARADKQSEGRHYYDPGRLLHLALGLTRYAVLRHDYLPHDLTLYLYREPR